jgi:hypothetical protein
VLVLAAALHVIGTIKSAYPEHTCTH